jgi:energy-coupling factor transporter ATP-binding protein EcfA2
LHVKFDEIIDKYIEVNYNEEGRKKSFDLFMAGSGFQQFVYLFGFIRLRNPDLILLDEPDVHLHGTMQGSLLNELKKLISEEGKQVIFAPHSRDLITRLEPDQIIFLSEGNVNRLQINFDIYDILETLGSFDNIQIAQLQEYRRLLVVEDHDDWKYIQIFGRKLIGDSDWQKVERRLAIYPAKGNPYKQDMLKLKDQLTGMFKLGLSGKPLKFFVISDWDYYPEREDLLNKKTSLNQNILYHIWKKAEIENYILVPEAIKRLVTDRNNGNNLFSEPLINEFHKLVNDSKNTVWEKVNKSCDEFNRTEKKGWDIITVNREAHNIIEKLWDENKLNLTDAKEFILPGLKRWLQQNGFSQFSDFALAESINPEEIDFEIKEVIQKIANFAGIIIKK